MSRRPHIVKKVRTDFGPLFFHADMNKIGAIESCWIDHAQKMEESTVANLLDLVCHTFNGMVNQVQTPGAGAGSESPAASPNGVLPETGAERPPKVVPRPSQPGYWGQ